MENRINTFIFSGKLYPSSTGSTSHSNIDRKPDINQSAKLFNMAVEERARRSSENPYPISDDLFVLLLVFVKTAVKVSVYTFAQQD